MINVEETNIINPVCPHCGEEITKVFARLMSTAFGKRYIYFCSLCKKVIGVSQRKGFWMG
ncbi:MAG: hypothetical protein HND52_16035 [Ignavibacteriae bacterium]|nr:hypothetical protein [Ignavibacteriota bacterium]NOG99466.1 hypothetical protein [Ignavibacteriota bacterium]